MSMSSTSLNLQQQVGTQQAVAKKKITILTPEDDQFTKFMLKQTLPGMLKEEMPSDSFELHSAQDLEEATRTIQRQQEKGEDIDVILTDNDMAKNNEGVELIHRVASGASQDRHMPLTVMNSATSIPKQLGDEVRSLGGYFMQKPLKMKQFVALVKENLPQIRQRQIERQSSEQSIMTIQSPKRQLSEPLEDILLKLDPPLVRAKSQFANANEEPSKKSLFAKKYTSNEGGVVLPFGVDSEDEPKVPGAAGTGTGTGQQQPLMLDVAGTNQQEVHHAVVDLDSPKHASENGCCAPICNIF